MKNSIVILLLSFPFCLWSQAQKPQKNYEQTVAAFDKKEGFFDFYWDDDTGKIWLEIDKLDQEFLYVNSLSAGVGSNDIGLDRGQLGDNRIVRFEKVGPKILMVQGNLGYRAESDNPEETASVAQAFARSVLWGFKIEKSNNGNYLVDFTPFLMHDAHGVSKRLKQRSQGNFKLDKSRSAVYLPRTKSFPQNTEFEATLTFTGDATGAWLRSVAPTSSAITVRQHHSFVQLPDDGYKKRTFDPRSGFFGISYQDYATPIDAPLVKKFINRHRLEKKNPSAAISEAVEPIIYYVDRGAPEPIKSALIEGASWWNQAFEAAGYKDAFQVKEFPADADPMDVRYNLIQWVHRSTRGWSYGASVEDPRTGEIIKGHVSLGSLRVRQDYLIAQGLLSPFEEGKDADPRMLEMALARLRQLSAHEVGHTIGLAHNFAASTDGRTSVMDYPHPLVSIDKNGQLNFDNAYDDKIGAWDKRAIIYGYQDFPEGTNEAEALQKILAENSRLGLQFISDADARPQGGAHPAAHLWDNGSNPTDELVRLIALRKQSLANFGIKSIPKGENMASLEKVLVPVYLMHRYQVEAVSKLIGGEQYSYAVRGDGQIVRKIVDQNTQTAALNVLLQTMKPEFLEVPSHISNLIPPQPLGYDKGREFFKARTGMTFDAMAAAETAANNTLTFLCHPQRLARVYQQHANGATRTSLEQYLNKIHTNIQAKTRLYKGNQKAIAQQNEQLYLHHLLKLANNQQAPSYVRAAVLYKINDWKNRLGSLANDAHDLYLKMEIERFFRNPEAFKAAPAKAMPDGSPIGCGHDH